MEFFPYTIQPHVYHDLGETVQGIFTKLKPLMHLRHPHKPVELYDLDLKVKVTGSVFLFLCKSRDSEKTVEWIITKLVQVMDLGPGLVW